MSEETSIVKREAPEIQLSLTSGASIAEVVKQQRMITELLKTVLVKGTHYDKIPGTDKDVLLKAGAEKLCVLFKLGLETQAEEKDLGNGHREVIIRATLIHYPSGAKVGEGVGSCSTLETKYRYRNVDDYEDTGEPVPWDDYKAKKAEYRKQGLGAKKVEGNWLWVRFLHSDAKQENPDLADTWNTVLKMAKKRAMVDAVLTATGASDIFTQDVEEGQEKKSDDDRHQGSSEEKSETRLGGKTSLRTPQEQRPPWEGALDELLKEAKEPGSLIWRDCRIKDVTEDEVKHFFLVHCGDGSVAGTMNSNLAHDIAQHDKMDLEVRPGRKEGSFEVIGFQLPLEVELEAK